MSLCISNGCKRPAEAKGLCHTCYERQRREKNKVVINARQRIRLKTDKEFAERMRAYNKKGRTKFRMALKYNAIYNYSNGTMKCACRGCGETNPGFLTIDHINNDGALHRRQINLGRGSGIHFYHWLKKNSYPSGYQVLCYNCNCGRYRNG